MANFNFNGATLGGRLTADPELKTTSSGITVTSFTIAINRRAGEDKEAKSDFINCIAWRQTAEFITRYFKKGSSICVVGAIQTRSWTDKDGNKKYATEVVVERAYFVDSKSENSVQNTNTGTYDNAYSQASFQDIDTDDVLPFRQ